MSTLKASNARSLTSTWLSLAILVSCTACGDPAYVMAGGDTAGPGNMEGNTDATVTEEVAPGAVAEESVVEENAAEGSLAAQESAVVLDSVAEDSAPNLQQAPPVVTVSETAESTESLLENDLQGAEASSSTSVEQAPSTILSTQQVAQVQTTEPGNTVECAPGQFVVAEPTEGAPRQCDACPAGMFSGSNNAEGCSACPAGTFASGNGTDECSPWAECSTGEYVASEGTETNDRQCLRCPAGTFSDSNNAGACVAWSNCAPGEYVAVEESETNDRQCEPCAPGMFSETENAGTCVHWEQCTDGEEVITEPSASNDRECTGG